MNNVKPLLPKVTKVQALDNFQLRLEFTDGSLKYFDVKPYLQYPAFERLKQGGLFAKAHVSNGTVIWDDRLDLAPETLYLKGRNWTEVVTEQRTS
jgi:predicted ATP-grasp superfamily ATP-dependent carboligase